MSQATPPGAAVHQLTAAPRRVRASLAGETVADTTDARYFWEWPHYPHYYLPAGSLRPGLLGARVDTRHTEFGALDVHDVAHNGIAVGAAAQVVTRSHVEGLDGLVRLDFGAMDAWFEEDEEIFVHPRSPYVRVDALRSRRQVRVERDGVLLAESSAPVAVFETGLPTRWYVDRSAVDWSRLQPSQTRTACPYKGRTTGYWSVVTPVGTYDDTAWRYDFPTAALLPVLGLVAFLNERVDLYLDGELIARPHTHMS